VPVTVRAVKLRKDAKIERIRAVPLFSHCSKKELESIARIADEVPLEEGALMTKQGARGHEFGVIINGTANVIANGTQLATLGPGDFFGEIALVSDVPRTATITATSPVRLLVITARDFRQLMRQSPDVQNKVLQALAHRVVRLGGDSH
jgi:CRP/FNR family transcriptional regulator, cyclic AMP receptor protein